MPYALDQSWKDWVILNISRGCDKNEIIQILLDHQFDPDNIIDELKDHPHASELQDMVRWKVLHGSHARLGAPQKPTESQANAQAIDGIILPWARRLDTRKAHLYTLDHFLTADECSALIALIRSRCQPSTITNPNEPDKTFRTSQTCDLGLLKDEPIVQEIDRRIAEYMGMEIERAEPIQGQYYQIGQEFKTHTDYFEPNSEEYQKFAADTGQRTWTFMVYLNEVTSGGETEFPALDFSVTPSPGKAVIWNSIHPNGMVNAATAHWAKPIIRGEKFVITKWFRTFGNLRHIYQAPERKTTPIFTREGFKKMMIPKPLFDELREFYKSQTHQPVLEKSDAIGTYIQSQNDTHPCRMIELNSQLKAKVLNELTPLLEQWVQHPLEPSAVYGIREYQRASTLGMHADRIETHLVSAILNIAQKVDSDWPLHIHDHFGKLHHVIMKPGEMLFYESARLDHGRPTPLDGDYFANIFTHTRPLEPARSPAEM